jgi:hypothetical protein
MSSRARTAVSVLLATGIVSLAIGLALNVLALFVPSPRPGECGQIVVVQMFLHLVGAGFVLLGGVLLLWDRDNRRRREAARLGTLDA